MAKILMLKFNDESSKECEVTGRDMGSSNTFYKPFSSLKPGFVAWDTKQRLNHIVEILEIGEDYVLAAVTTWRGTTIGGPYKVHIGEDISQSYYFGEWYYGYSLALVWEEE